MKAHTICSCVTDNIIIGPVSIIVQGEVLLNAEVEMNNVTMKFAERGALIIDHYASLRATGSTFTSCSGKMWRGIEVRKNGRLFAENAGTDECEVSDAYEGVLFNEMSNGFIRRTNFINNFTGIRTFGSPSGQMVNFNKRFVSCEFLSNATLLDVYSNVIPLPANGISGYAGIVAENEMMTISRGSVNNPSSFESFSNGIVANNCIINVSNTSFENMQSETDYNYLGFQGNGIHIYGTERWTSLFLRGFSSTPTFLNCEDGVEGFNSAITINSSIFNNVNRGIASSFSLGKSLTCHSNEINASLRGIDLMGMDFSGKILIEGNEINMNNTISANGVRGISMENYDFMSSPVQSKFSCNNINLNQAEIGIFVNSANLSNEPTDFNLALLENVIIANDNDVFLEGVSFAYSKNFLTIGNSVSGDGSTNNGTGYRFMMSPGGIIHNNFSTGMHRGFFFEHDSKTPEEFRNNTMEVNWHGLELDPMGQIGFQSLESNNWTGYLLVPKPYDDIIVSSKNTGAVNFNTVIVDAQNSKFEVSDAHSPTSSRFPDFYAIINDWFEDVSGTEILPTYSTCAITREINPFLTVYDSLTVMDSIFSSVFEDELREISKINLYNKLKWISQNSSLTSYYETFLNSFNTTTNGQILSIRDSINETVKFSTGQLYDHYQRDSSLHSNLELLQEQFYLNPEYIIPDSINILLNSEYLDSLSSENHNKLSEVTSWAIESLNNVIPSTHIEEYFATSYLAVMRLLSSDYDAGELIETLNPIADLCPEEYGPGVFLARSALNMLAIKNNYVDETICYPPLRKFADIVISPSKDQNFIIYPNPANDRFFITAEFSHFEQYELSVEDLSGRNIPHLILNKDEKTIHLLLPAVEPGSYIVNLSTPDNQFTGNVIIIKQ